MLKQLKRNGVIAWSPSPDHSNFIAVGTAAGSIGDFGTNTEVEVVTLTTTDPQDIFMPVLGTAEAAEKFHALSWGKTTQGSTHPHGILAGAMSNGAVALWDPAALMAPRYFL